MVLVDLIQLACFSTCIRWGQFLLNILRFYELHALYVCVFAYHNATISYCMLLHVAFGVWVFHCVCFVQTTMSVFTAHARMAATTRTAASGVCVLSAWQPAPTWWRVKVAYFILWYSFWQLQLALAMTDMLLSFICIEWIWSEYLFFFTGLGHIVNLFGNAAIYPPWNEGI